MNYNTLTYFLLEAREIAADLFRFALATLKAVSVALLLLSPLLIVGVVEHIVDNSLPPVSE